MQSKVKEKTKAYIRKAIVTFFDFNDFIGSEVVNEREKRINRKYNAMFPGAGADEEMTQRMREAYSASVKSTGTLLISVASISIAILTLIASLISQ